MPLHFTIRNRVPHNKHVTNRACSGRTGEYWPSLRSVLTATSAGQYSLVRPSRSVSKRLIWIYQMSAQNNIAVSVISMAKYIYGTIYIIVDYRVGIFPFRAWLHLYGQKVSREKGSPSYNWANLGEPTFPSFHYNTWRTVYMTNKKLARLEGRWPGLVTCKAGSSSFDGRVTLLAGPTFLHINTLAPPAGSARSRRDDQSMPKHCLHWKTSSWLGKKGQVFSHVNAR